MGNRHSDRGDLSSSSSSSSSSVEISHPLLSADISLDPPSDLSSPLPCVSPPRPPAADLSALELALLRSPLAFYLHHPAEPGAKERYLDCTLSFFGHHGLTLPFLASLVDHHARAVTDPSILFRSNSHLCNLLSRLVKRLALPYLLHALRGPLALAASFPSAHSLSALSRLPLDSPPPDALALDPSLLLWRALCQSFLDAVLLAPLPPALLALIQLLHARTARLHPRHALSAAASFLFHRCVIAAICTPDRFRLPAPPSPEARRVLVLTSMLLQNLVNGARFSRKDSHLMRAMQPWCAQQLPRVEAFTLSLVASPVVLSSGDWPATRLAGYLDALDGLKDAIREHQSHQGESSELVILVASQEVPPLQRMAWLVLQGTMPLGEIAAALEPEVVQSNVRWALIHRDEIYVKMVTMHHENQPSQEDLISLYESFF